MNFDFNFNSISFQFGFFKRGTRDDLVQLKRESGTLRSYWIVPGDGADYEEEESYPLQDS